jgi:hypothetical protein
VSDRVHDFEEAGADGQASGLRSARASGLGNGQGDGASRARAALGLLASRLLALQLALGLGAVRGLGALVEAGEFLANRLALGLGGFAGGVAVSRLADRLALGAAFLLALVLGAADGANGLLAVNGALSAGGFLALHLALGAFAHGVADSRAGGIIALPLAHRVALLCRDSSHHENDNDGEEEAGHL